MLISVKALRGLSLSATDDTVGDIRDFLFDERSWVIRYLVVDTGRWLPGRKVLILPHVLGSPEWLKRTVPVNLTKDQVKESPEIDTDAPVSRQHEIALHRHYDYRPYWTYYGGPVGPVPVAPLPRERFEELESLPDETGGDPHLRSVDEVTGYHVEAKDGSIGHVQEFIIDDENWVIGYVVVDTRNWLPGRHVLVAPEWFERISWSDKRVYVDLDREQVRNSPKYDPTAPVNREHEEELYDYYGRPAYWRQIERTRGIGGGWV